MRPSAAGKLFAVLTLLLAAIVSACGGNDGKAIASPATTAPAKTSSELGPVGKDCIVAQNRGDVTFAQGRDFFCIAWRDSYVDELGFRVVLRYQPGNEEFSYPVAANQVDFFVPPEDWPEDVRPRPDLCLCNVSRKDFQVTVYARRPSGEVVVGAITVPRG